MTKKQARAKAIEAIDRVGLVFKHGGCDCSELRKFLENERAALGIGRLMVQAGWLTYQADGRFDHCFRDTAYHLFYQCYLKQKPKRKTKSKK